MSAEPVVATEGSQKKTIRVLFNRVLVRRLEAAETFKAGGFIVQPEQHQLLPQEGIVLSIGKRVEEVQVGDHVVFGRHSGVEVPLLEGDTIFILRDEEVMGIRE